MTEEKKDVIEIKKESLKQFFTIVGASFIGCFLAILLAGQLLKPKAPCCHHHRIMAPPPCAMMMDRGHHHKYFAKHRQDRPIFEQRIKQQIKLQGEQKAPVAKLDIKKVEQK